MRVVCLVCLLAGCSAAQPPLISDGDGGIDHGEAAAMPPCYTAAPGCPCAEAGAKQFCGYIYRRVGNYVACQPGYLTCEADGGWGDCLGASIYDGGQ
jgi:hypothetical protein